MDYYLRNLERLAYEERREYHMSRPPFHAIYNMIVLMSKIDVFDLELVPTEQKGTDYDLVTYVEKYEQRA